MKYLLLPFLLLLNHNLKSQDYFETFDVDTKASLRGLSAVSAQVCWASGSEGTVMLTTDGGIHWHNRSPKGYDTLQFRDIQAFNADTAIILSAGLPAVILRTTNGGQNWQKHYDNKTKGVFFDAMDFWDEQHGIAFSDAITDHLLIIQTKDGGLTWQALDESTLPQVAPKQGGFAASGTCLKTFGKSSVIIGLGGASADALLSDDYGLNWGKVSIPLDFGEASKGIFSFDFRDHKVGFCVGGDYTGDSLSFNSVAVTKDGGRSWNLIDDPNIQGKYRSCINMVNNQGVVAVSRTGMSLSKDGGESWNLLGGSYYTASTKEGVTWLSGPNGSMAKLILDLP